MPLQTDRKKILTVVFTFFIAGIQLCFLSSCGISAANQIVIEDHFQNQSIKLDSTLKIVCWNIEKNKGGEQWTEDILTIIKNYHPDLFLFQEVRFEPKIDETLQKSKMGWIFSPNIKEKNPDAYCGVLTASPISPQSNTSIISNCTEPFTNTPKTSLITSYLFTAAKDTLLTINIHGINFVGLKTFEVQLTEIIESVKSHSGPIIFCGDFNTWSKNRIELLSRRLKEELKVIPVEFDKNEVWEIRNILRSPPFDHIFYSYEMLRIKHNSPEVLKKISSSDHKPLFVEFYLKH